MTPKTKRRLRVENENVFKHPSAPGKWCAWIVSAKGVMLFVGSTKRQAMAACERHAREQKKKGKG